MAEPKADNGKISGPERAAILLMSLGEGEAAQVLKHMGAKDVQRVGQAMASLANVSRERVDHVVTRFVTELDTQTSIGVGSDDYVRRVLVGALGEDKAGSLIDRILLGRNSKGLEALKWMETRAVADLVRNEHPQIVAIVLAYLDSDQAAEVLSLLPERMKSDVLMRIARLDGIQPAALRELDEIMEKQFSGGTNLKSSSVGGIKVAANILNLMDSTVESAILDRINEIDTDLSQRIQDLMFVFDDLGDVDDRGIQALMREVNGDLLTMALKGADSRVKDKVLKNMSKRAADMLVEDMAAKGPVRLADVEAAQKEILLIARRLSESGEIQLGGKGDDFV
ncbi:flagellar motor switch protein FliG [Hydrocarboniphaga daqingensis]|jgi:flagellar motor switch protein FliG|uniref:Flagellar motor switch protein FliG n=1 Tax=Hydrocarboniphaga daqingensis TaxID=490188 RepID=A0A1M5JRT7_9GAMM|nr:flagellar motor switch protein FliG [Hydrocarboniphaga daqingensis]SHG42979.1 flagellar motor switch protein FliG [Hydrocarboniphaga daqingensis]